MEIVEVCGRKPELIPTLLTVWENSVRATHLFLSEAEIAKIKEYVPQALAEAEHLVIAENEEKTGCFYGNQERSVGNAFSFAVGKRKRTRQMFGAAWNSLLRDSGSHCQ